MPDAEPPAPRPRRLHWHALLVTVPAGALFCSLAFDLVSWTSDVQYTWAQAAYALVALGLAGGAVAAVAGLVELTRIPRPSAAFSAARRHLLLVDAGLAVFAVSLLIRRSEGSKVAVGNLGLALSLVGTTLIGLAILQGSAVARAHQRQQVAPEG